MSEGEASVVVVLVSGSVGFSSRGAHQRDESISLDESQATVIAAGDETHCIVLGAPGTGKTRLVVEIVADRVNDRGYDPSEILVIASSRKAATALRDRIALRITVPAPGPLARTLNSVAFQIVRAASAGRGEEPPRLLTGAEQDSIVSDLLRGHVAEASGPRWPSGLDADVRELSVFRTELRELMMRATELGITPERLSELGATHDRPEWMAAARFIEEYESVIDSFETRYLDSSELLAEATRSVRNGTGLDGVRVVIFDDFHEQGPGALEMVSALAQRGVTVIACGDPDVTTSTFRGADPRALAELSRSLGSPAETFVLSTAYRHGAPLRDLVREITDRIGVAGAVLHRRAEASVGPELGVERGGSPNTESVGGDALRPIVRIEAASTPTQYAEVARILREHHVLGGIPWARMGVIVRSGATIEPLSRALATAEVPTVATSRGRSLSADFASRQLILAAALAAGHLEPRGDLLTQLLCGPLGGLDSLALRRVRLALRHRELANAGDRTAEELLIDEMRVPGGFGSIDSAAGRAAARFAQTVHAARTLAADGGSAEDILWVFWERSGLAESWSTAAAGSGIAADEANRHLDSVMALFTSAKRFVERYPSEPAVRYFADQLDSQVPEDSLTPRAAVDTVWVGTPNGAVGHDFDVVVIAALNDGVWPHLRIRGSLLYPQQLSAVVAGLPVADVDERSALLSDELRMFALAVSRARRQIVFASTANDDERPSPFMRFAGIADTPVSPAGESYALSLRGIVGRLRRVLVTENDTAAASSLALLASEGVPGAHPEEWYGLRKPSTTAPLVDLGEWQSRDGAATVEVPHDVGRTATVSVSPSQLETFEKSPLVWFIDAVAPSPSGTFMAIGTLVHGAMEAVSQGDDTSVDVSALWRAIESEWKKLRFDSAWIAEAERRRVDSLLEGLSDYLTDARRLGSTAVGSEIPFDVALGPVLLRGTIDRIERNSDGSLSIIDLKTGKTHLSADAVALNAQLAAYQLAVTESGLGGEDAGGQPGAVGAPPIIAGASLLYVKTSTVSRYKLVTQEPLTAETRAVFRERVIDVGRGMAGATFWGELSPGAHDPSSSVIYRIHLVPAVSS